jgi:hypothetical protein
MGSLSSFGQINLLRSLDLVYSIVCVASGVSIYFVFLDLCFCFIPLAFLVMLVCHCNYLVLYRTQWHKSVEQFDWVGNTYDTPGREQLWLSSGTWATRHVNEIFRSFSHWIEAHARIRYQWGYDHFCVIYSLLFTNHPTIRCYII